MAAPRASSFKALRNLQKGSTRSLHMTGVHASPKPIDPTHKSTYMPWSLQDLRSECRKRTLALNGGKPELIDRLAAHDSLQARAFSLAARRISKEQSTKHISTPASTTTSRHFNTSRANKAVGDTSTIDFAYLPKLFEGSFIPQPAAIRVPILPNIISEDAEASLEEHPHIDAAAGGYQDTGAGVSIMRPEISTVTHTDSSSLSHMSDVGDGHSTEMSVDQVADLSKVIGQNAQQMIEAVKKSEPGTIRQIWNSMLDDIFSSSKPSK